jgi:SAM-dependent methyltransferase
MQSDQVLIEDLPRRQLLRGLFHLLFGREPVLADDDFYVSALEAGTMSSRQLVEWLIHSAEWSHVAPMSELGPSLHYGRGVFVRSLPRASRILDIGGASLGDPTGALVHLGYPYRFDELVIIDLPSEERHPLYQEDARLSSIDTDKGRVRYRYHSMTDLDGLASSSFDLVYSGESIEHITRREAERVFAQVRRVLRPGGAFVLDTPNARLTRLQQPDAFIDPDHKYEYVHSELVAMFRGHGFSVERAHGINYGGGSIERGLYSEGDIATHRGLFDAIEDCYLLAYVCRRSRSDPFTIVRMIWWRLTRPTTLTRRGFRRARRSFQRRGTGQTPSGSPRLP